MNAAKVALTVSRSPQEPLAAVSVLACGQALWRNIPGLMWPARGITTAACEDQLQSMDRALHPLRCQVEAGGTTATCRLPHALNSVQPTCLSASWWLAWPL